MAQTRRVATIKIWYDTGHCSEEAILTEIESWDDIEDVQCVGNALAAPLNQGVWPEDEQEEEETEWEEL